MRFIPQSSTVTVLIGPFVDPVDASPETGLTIASSDILLSKNGAATAAKNESSGATHRAHGFYSITLNATDTNTLRHLDIIVYMAGSALVVHNHFAVVPAGMDTTLNLAPGAGAGLATVDGLLNYNIEDQPNVKLKEALAYILAHAAGISSGMNTVTGRLKSPNGVEDRAVATLDGLGNRTAMTLTPPSL